MFLSPIGPALDSATSQPPLAVFIHVPKSAGNTIYALLRHTHPREALLKLHPTTDPSKPFTRIAARRRRKLRLLYGHIDFSIAAALPANTVYFTLLRDPVERVISHYYFCKEDPSNRLHALAMGSTLSEWVSGRGLAEMDNGQVRRVAGAMNAPLGAVDSAMLDKAKRNIDTRIAFTGIVERFAQSQVLLCRQFGWPLYRYGRHNVGQSKPPRAQISSEVLRTIEASNRFDRALYEHVCAAFERACGAFDMERALVALRTAPLYDSAREPYLQRLLNQARLRSRTRPAAAELG